MLQIVLRNLAAFVSLPERFFLMLDYTLSDMAGFIIFRGRPGFVTHRVFFMVKEDGIFL